MRGRNFKAEDRLADWVGVTITSAGRTLMQSIFEETGIKTTSPL